MSDQKMRKPAWSHDYVLRKAIGRNITVFIGQSAAFKAKLLNSDKWSIEIEVTGEDGDISRLIYFKHAIDGIAVEN